MATETATKTAAKKKNIHQKMLEVMEVVERIPKRGHNDFHNYDYATEADILEAVRGGLAKAGLMIYPSRREDTTERRTTDDGKWVTERRVLMDYTIVNADNPEETMVLTFPGESQDNGDKAIYKALTGAEKYFLMKTFMIPTGDDPENDNGQRAAQPAAVDSKGKNTAPDKGRTVDELRQEIGHWLFEMAEHDGERAKQLLVNYSAFNGTNKQTGEPEVVSTDDLERLSIGWARRVHHDVKDAYEQWVGERMGNGSPPTGDLDPESEQFLKDNPGWPYE